MQPSLLKIQKDISVLKWYSIIITVLFVTTIGYLLSSRTMDTRFKEISVERINVVESNGRTRIVISNKERSPEVLAYGKSYTPPIPGHNRPGLIFYNDEGTEDGGLIFMGHKDSNGKYIATGHLSFDQYNQNQVLYLQYADENGQQTTGLHIDDWQTDPPFWKFRAKYKNIQLMPDGPVKDSLLKKLLNSKPGQSAFAQRVFVGRDDNKTAMLMLSDRKGQPRLQLMVDSAGTPRLNFFDASGHITYSLPK
ncbi:MAG TPA: hypothetical protein VGM63_20845 [Mucilaginibacter sp.]|jgi:hypothetical protein